MGSYEVRGHGLRATACHRRSRRERATAACSVLSLCSSTRLQAGAMVGEGVRWSATRDVAWRLIDGMMQDSLPLEQAAEEQTQAEQGLAEHKAAREQARAEAEAAAAAAVEVGKGKTKGGKDKKGGKKKGKK